MANVKHGNGSNERGRSPTYITWMNMKQRCLNPDNPNWPNYGGRGIKVDPSWIGRDGFATFLADMGEKPTRFHSIERKNNSDGYHKANCEWADAKRQANNRRRAVTQKLDATDADQIRWLVREGGQLQTVVAAAFGVSITHVNGIVHGRVHRA